MYAKFSAKHIHVSVSLSSMGYVPRQVWRTLDYDYIITVLGKAG